MKMHIGAAGIVRADFSRNDNVKHKQNHGFVQLLSGLGQPNSSIGREEAANLEPPALSNSELKEAVQLLQASDLTEIESGSALLEQMLSEGNVDLSKLILEQLQLNEEDIRLALKTFLEGIKAKNDDEQTAIPEEELLKLMEELPNMDINEALMSLVQILPSVNIDQMSLTTDQPGVQLAKTIKLLELLLQYEQPNLENIQMKKLLQKTVEKLEAFLNGKGSAGNGEILDKVFTPLVKEVNQQLMAKEQTRNELTGLNQAEKNQSTADGNQNIRYTANGQIHSLSFLSKQDQLVLLQEQSGQMVSKDQLIKQFESILAKSQLVTSGGNQKLFIKLYPEHLGALRIELTQQDSLLTAKILTTNANAKDLLESQIQNLKQAFLSQSLQVEKIEIAQQFQQERFFNRDPQKEQEQRQPGEQDEQQESGNHALTVSFEEILLNVEA